MIFAVITLLLVFASFFPSFWVRHVMRKYHVEVPELAGTGGELAKHLIKKFELSSSLEETDEGDLTPVLVPMFG